MTNRSIDPENLLARFEQVKAMFDSAESTQGAPFAQLVQVWHSSLQLVELFAALAGSHPGLDKHSFDIARSTVCELLSAVTGAAGDLSQLPPDKCKEAHDFAVKIIEQHTVRSSRG